ncbi:hypothetical protein AB5I41_31555 [Sphingomonas sp. MMS24-JH45]
MAQTATAAEIKALLDIHDWKEKAAASTTPPCSRQMQRVRDGKRGRTAKPNAAQPSGKQRAFTEQRAD